MCFYREPPLEETESKGVIKSIVKKITTKPSPTILRKMSPCSSSKTSPGATTSGQVKENPQKMSQKDGIDYKINRPQTTSASQLRGKLSNTAPPNSSHMKQLRQQEEYDKQRRELLGLVESKTPKVWISNVFRVSYSGGGGFTPGMNLTWGGYPPPPINWSFLGILFSGFENLITTCKCNLKKKNVPPLIFFWRKPWCYYFIFANSGQIVKLNSTKTSSLIHYPFKFL
jgi:hypothetical protein